jgi:hypothetical protein
MPECEREGGGGAARPPLTGACPVGNSTPLHDPAPRVENGRITTLEARDRNQTRAGPPSPGAEERCLERAQRLSTHPICSSGMRGGTIPPNVSGPR